MYYNLTAISSLQGTGETRSTKRIFPGSCLIKHERIIDQYYELRDHLLRSSDLGKISYRAPTAGEKRHALKVYKAKTKYENSKQYVQRHKQQAQRF